MSLETIQNKLSGIAVTQDGKRWLTQALYPPGDLGGISIPTRTHYPTLRMEYRPSATIQRPTGLAADSTWDLMVLSLPWDSTALVWCAAPSGADFRTVVAGTNVGYLACQPNLVAGEVPYSLVQRNTAGAATANTTFDFVRNSVQHTGFRITSKSYTAHMTASDLYNGGSVTTCQYDSDWRPSAGYLPNGGRLYVPCFGSVPLNETEMLQSSPYAVVTEARDGIFVPHRLQGSWDFVQPLTAVGRVHAAVAILGTATLSDSANGSQLIAVAPAFLNADGLQGGATPSWLASVLATPNRPDDTGFGSVTSCVSIFRGLNYAATITVTAHVGFEYVLAATSPFRTLAVEPAEPDTRALTAYFEVAARMPHAYPASYNALGLILPALGSALRAALPHIPKVVGALAPVVSSMFEKRAAPPPPSTRPISADMGLISAGPAASRTMRAEQRPARSSEARPRAPKREGRIRRREAQKEVKRERKLLRRRAASRK